MEARYLYPMEDIQDIHYYYGIPSDELEQDSGLMREIKNQTKKLSSENDSNISFSVYPTTFEDKIVLAVTYTKEIQS